MHRCPAPGCEEQVPYEMLACRAHWFSIPKLLRVELWHAYRRHGIGSDEHTAAIDSAIRFLQENAEARA